jgi:hypothetical protein
MKRALIAGACLAALIAPPGATAGPLPPAPITLTEASADAQRFPFARWTPDYPIVNVLVSSRPARDADTRPTRRYWVQTGFYDFLNDGPEPFWRGDHRLIPGIYYTAIDGDGPFLGELPWTASTRFRVKPRPGEWTGPTSQKRYIRLTRPRPGVLRRVSFSIYARSESCSGHTSFVLPRPVPVAAEGKFSARFENVWDLPRQTAGDISINGRVRRNLARGVLRVKNLFEGGCKTGRVTWSARLR